MALSKILSLILSCTMLIGTQAVFAPADRAALRTAINACINEPGTGGDDLYSGGDGSCPNFAISNDDTGNPYGAIGDWDVSAVTAMNDLLGKKFFNADISKWNTGAVTTMSRLFTWAEAFNSDVSKWNTGAVTDMIYMFYKTPFNQDVSNWNTGAVTNMLSMFGGAAAFNQDVSNWNTGAVVEMSYMFAAASAFNQDVSKWNTGAVTKMRGMFSYASVFNSDLNPWDLGAVTNMNNMFDASGFTRVVCGPEWALLNGYYAGQFCCDSGTYMTNPHKPFNQATSCAVCPSTGCTPEMLHGTAKPFVATDQATLRTAVVKCLDETSDGSCPNYAKQNGAIGDWDVSAVTTMVGSYPSPGMFQGATQFNQDLSKWDVSKLTDMSSMFSGAAAFNQDLSNWDTGAVTDMNNMFREATAFNQPLTFDTSKVTSMSYMFADSVAFNQDLSNWNTFAVTDMSYMFKGATSFNSDIFRHMSGVKNMAGMFWGASVFNQDVSKWDTGSAVNMVQTFQEASAFNQDLSKWDIATVRGGAGDTMESIFMDSGMTQTLCGTHVGSSDDTGWGAGIGRSGAGLGTSTARLGCCPTGTFMAQPNLSPFTVATACEACPIGQWGSAVPDDLTSCNKVMYCKHVSLGVTDCTETDVQSCSLSDGLAGCDDLQLAKIKAHYHNHSLASCTY